MMHKCGSSSCTCSYGLFQSQGNSFSMPYETDMYSFISPSSSVDCTLSLGTPSTRLSEEDEKRNHHDQNQRSGSCMTNFCWDFWQTQQNHKTIRGGNSCNSISGSSSNNDPLLARRCSNCDTTSTPLWRNGPRGPKSLCNACGIRFKKEKRRATAANANSSSATAAAAVAAEQQHGYYNMPYYNDSPANEFRFIDDSDNQTSDTGIASLSWRLNVADRPGLVHGFTR